MPLNFGYITVSVFGAKDVELFSERDSGEFSVCQTTQIVALLQLRVKIHHAEFQD
ncbi:hypothetical protein DPMN_176412 [Dreissena polymorpha]|uniref:Uncharacterized protein n=1 Tax=Dreissena polymorpha TaxID=45954 RepID=A0A9D4E6V3_DREPO|nr:hypothetical protein DPMN_176412 [Dreissena polymorpha]